MTMDDYELYLAHHGIQGQKWGIRRYQNRDGSLTAEGRRRLGYGEPRKSLKQKISEKRAERKARNTKTPEQEREELKEYLRKHPKKLPKYNHELTQEEAAEIINNINFDRRLKDIKKQEFDRGLDKIRTVTNTMQTVGSLINAGKTMYNNYVEINNALVDAGTINSKRKTKIGERPEDAKKKEHQSALDTYLRNHTATDFYNDRASWTVEDAKQAQQYFNNLSNLQNGNKGNKGGNNSIDYETMVQDIIDRLKEEQNN